MRFLWILTLYGALLITGWAFLVLPAPVLIVGVAYMTPMTLLFLREIYERSMQP
ncbi:MULTISPECIES: hypothetical protein [unclassified Cryobacterium]|uniref:hypothetical protein n=1 Tax=unclassified Cryobacterium TaxID=2649013 RepID=UPI00141BB383|nr:MULTISPECIES: hypothetical protein [unclassified Cryobacterium]